MCGALRRRERLRSFRQSRRSARLRRSTSNGTSSAISSPGPRSSPATLRTRPEQPRARRVTRDEAERLLAACSPHLRDVVIAALETGCRKQELLTLQWQQVHWARNELYLPGAKTKTKRPRRIPISAALYEMLVRRQRHPAGQTYGP